MARTWGSIRTFVGGLIMAAMQFPLNYAPGVVADDTVLADGGRYIDADKVRWVRPDAGQSHRPQLMGGWERLSLSEITGICRTVFAWMDNAGRINLAFGTHSKLLVWRGGSLYDITPYGPPVKPGADPLSVTNGSAVVTVHHEAHGYEDATDVKVYGATALGGITPNGGPFTITVSDADTYTFTFTSAASSTAATGGGSAVVIVPQTELPAGQTNGTGTAGYSVGGYGVGGYGQPSTQDYFPRTWSFGTLGEALVASPRGGAIYIWENDSAARAEPITTAPLQVTGIMTTAERAILAMGCNEEVSDVFNPRCVRNCDLTDETIWTTDPSHTAFEKILEGAGRVIAGRNAGPAAFLWTDNEIYTVEYTAALDELYRFTRLGEDCGLIGPNAACIHNQQAFWLTPDVQFMTGGLGGEPAALESPMRAELRNNLTAAQRDKIIASTVSAFSEVWFFYPDSRDGLENSRAIFFHATDFWWSKAVLSRTAFTDAGPTDFPCGVDATGNAFWHERGRSNDGNAISWSLRAGPQYIDSGESGVFIRAFLPDFKDQVGSIDLSILTYEKPQSTAETFGPYSMTSGTEAVDMDVDGVIVAWEISGNSGPAFFRLGTPLVEGKATRRTR